VREFRLPTIGAGLLLAALTIIAYAPALRGGFVYDDAYYVRDNPFLKSAEGLRHIWFTTEFPDYFALSTTSFWLEWRLWGNNPLGYHVTNIVLHIVNALLLWLLLKRLAVPGAYVAALVFAVHPVTVESVAWISERKNLLSLLFALLATLAFLRWDETREWRWYLWAVGAFALALLSKTIVVMLPVVLLLVVWWRRCDESDPDCSRSVSFGHGRTGNEPSEPKLTLRLRGLHFQDFIAVVPFFALSLVMGLVTMWFGWHHSLGGEVVRNDSLPARLAGAGWITLFYAGKTLWPVDLCVIYPQWRQDVGTVVAWVPLVIFVALCMAQWRRRGAFVGLLCYVTLLFPVLGFFEVSFYSNVADHWQYVAMIPVIILVCSRLMQIVEQINRRWRPLIPAVIVAALGIVTWRQTHIWRDDETLWRDTVDKNPAAWMAHNNLANALLARGRVDEAVAHYGETIRLKPEYGNAHYNLGIVDFQRGDYRKAVAEFRETVRLKPKSAEAYNNLGAALTKVGQTNDAIAQFEIATRLAPNWEEPRANLAGLK
jgi:hypothetical protein